MEGGRNVGLSGVLHCLKPEGVTVTVSWTVVKRLLNFFSPQMNSDHLSSTNTHRGYLQTGNHYFLRMTSVSECRHAVMCKPPETFALTGWLCDRMPDTTARASVRTFGSSYLWERTPAAGAVRWPAPAGSAKHWDWTGSSIRYSSQVLVSLVGAGGRCGGKPVHHIRQRMFENLKLSQRNNILQMCTCLSTSQQCRNGNLLKLSQGQWKTTL